MVGIIIAGSLCVLAIGTAVAAIAHGNIAEKAKIEKQHWKIKERNDEQWCAMNRTYDSKRGYYISTTHPVKIHFVHWQWDKCH